jgi:putative hydrolase, CocE/NonD family
MPAANIKEFPLLKEYMEHLVKGYDNLELIHKEGKDMDLSRINVPVLGSAGWFDDSRNSTIEQYMELAEKGEGLAKESEIIIGPWEPGENLYTSGLELDFGKSCDKSQQMIAQEMLSWFDRWLKGIMPTKNHRPVRMFCVGPNIWEEANTWPIPGTKDLDLFLSSDGHANTRFGDGLLTLEKETNAGSNRKNTDSYLYNPERLIYTQSMGKDHRKLEEREDILVYTSKELQEDILVTGLIEAKLFISSSALDTDFMVKVLDMPGNDRAIAITEGATRAKYRNSWKEELLTPNEIYDIAVKAGYVNYCFKKGHKIRIEIASSNFMKFDYNHNTGKRVEYDADIICAVNTIHHSGQTPSKIVFPVRVNGIELS